MEDSADQEEIESDAESVHSDASWESDIISPEWEPWDTDEDDLSETNVSESQGMEYRDTINLPVNNC